MKFIHMADVHLGIQPDKGKPWSEAREQEIKETFVKVIEDAKTRQVDLLLIAGDLFHMPPSIGMLRDVDYMLSKLTCTKTIIIAGNRDYMKPDSPMATYQFSSKTICLSADKISNVYMKDINTCVTGYGYDRPVIRDDVLGRIDPGRKDAVNILLGCGGDRHHMPFRKEDIARKGFDYVALGGRTKAAHILKNRLAYSGCPEPIEPDEQGRKGYIMGEVTDEGTKIQWVPSNKRSYIDINITLTPELTPEAVVNKLEEMLMKLGNENIYTIIFKGFAIDGFYPNLNRIKERFMIRGVENLTINSRDEAKLREENEANLIGSFVTEISDSYTIDENIRNKAMRYGLEALIMSGEE